MRARRKAIAEKAKASHISHHPALCEGSTTACGMWTSKNQRKIIRLVRSAARREVEGISKPMPPAQSAIAVNCTQKTRQGIHAGMKGATNWVYRRCKIAAPSMKAARIHLA